MATKEQIEGIKLIGEWCKWYVAVDTAAIAGIGVMLKPSPGQHLSIFAAVPAALAILAFVLSIIFAAWTVSSLPEAVQDIWEQDDRPDIKDSERQDRIWNRDGTLFGTIKLSFAKLCDRQLMCFLSGIICFAIAVIAMAFVG